MTEWFFIIFLTLPGLCDTARCEQAQGAIRAEITAADDVHCVRLRKMLLRQLGGEANVKGTVTPCMSRTPTLSE